MGEETLNSPDPVITLRNTGVGYTQLRRQDEGERNFMLWDRFDLPDLDEYKKDTFSSAETNI